ncbi:MAG: sigma-70 family RNA polymerase sigma factor [Peptococcaceae bacterium]|nr:sigma-70 family RNA polymerase sigma factor [Peptococcaceae bacterium]
MFSILSRKHQANKKKEALALLFEWFGKRVYRAANYILKDPHLAEEVTQDTLLDAYHNLSQLRDIQKVEAWLVRIATNKACDVLRSRKRLFFQEEVPQAISKDTPEGNLIREEERQQVEEAILALPKDHQAVIFLKYYSELTTKQIAEALEIPEGTVKSRLRKARSLIAKKLIKNAPVKEGVN